MCEPVIAASFQKISAEDVPWRVSLKPCWEAL